MPIDRGIIEQQLEAIGESSHWWDVRELRDLPAVLRDGERILAIARGKLARLRWVRRTWLVVVTDERVLLMRSSDKAGWRHLEINANHIERVALRIGPFHGRVLLVAGGVTHRILAPRPEAYKLHGTLSALAESRPPVPGAARTYMIRRMFDHVLALPAVAFSPNELSRSLPAPPNDAVERRIDALEEQIQQLQQQVDFLEELLRKRQS
ncbi:hypothetical protein BH23GEM9_BH23GEM9_32030 [soil metagenome]